MNKKGFIYSILGIFMLAISALIILSIMSTTYDPKVGERMRLLKFNNAIYGLQAEMQNNIKDSVYPVAWKIGQDVDSNGVNVYLSRGDDALQGDLLTGFTKNFNVGLKTYADKIEGHAYVINQNGILLRVYNITEPNVTIERETYGLKISVRMRMEGEYQNMSYQDKEVQVTADVPVRLLDMYDKAKQFNDNYDPDKNIISPVRVFTYGLTYGRAYINAYSDLKDNSTLIKQGYFAYDPVSQLLSGDPEQMKGFQVGNLVDWGSIPASTAYSEWVYLGEPSYLPPGMDFNDSLAEKIRGFLAGNLDLDQINQEVKVQNPDADTMSEEQYRAASKAYWQYARDIQDLTDGIKEWEDTTATESDCKTFKKETKIVLEDVLEFVDMSKSQDAQDMEGQGNSTSSNADNTKFEDKYGSFEQVNVDGLKNYLKQISGDRPNFLTRLDDIPDGDADCSFCTSECISGDVCGKCPENGDEYTYNKDCVKDSCCITEGKDGCSESGKFCRTCNCECGIKSKLSKDISTTLKGIRDQLFPQIEYMRTLSDKYKDQADSISKLKETASDIKSRRTSSEGYDVRSRIMYDRVQYSQCLPLSDGLFPEWFGSSKGECYYKPIWRDVNKGVCGDVCTSGGLYGAQIAAASCAAIVLTGETGGLAGGAGWEVIKGAASWFPAIYDIRVEYTIDETLVDDKDRVMLHNLYAGNSDLYGENLSEKIFTHVAPVFVIYKNHKIKTGDVYVIVYVHIDPENDPDAPKKILKAMNNCSGNQCS